MTGKSPARVGITAHIAYGRNQPENWKRNTPLLPARNVESLPEEETTVAEAFREHGYATFMAGKWHLGPKGSWPEDHGFDINKGGWSKGGPYGGRKYFSPYGNPRLENGPPGEHLPARLAAETSEFIREHRDQPFFACLSFYSVHTPLMARKDLERKYQAKKRDMQSEGPTFVRKDGRKVRRVQNHAVYAAMVEAMDRAVGDVLATLEQQGMADETVVLFTSDNGGLSTSEGLPTSNRPLRAGKGWIYEGGIRVPAIARVPGVTSPGSVCSEPIVTIGRTGDEAGYPS